MEMVFEGRGRHGKRAWLEKDSRLRQKLQDKKKFKSSFRCVLSFSLLCSQRGYILFSGQGMWHSDSWCNDVLGKAGCL